MNSKCSCVAGVILLFLLFWYRSKFQYFGNNFCVPKIPVASNYLMRDSVVWYYKYVLSTNANQGGFGQHGQNILFGPWKIPQNTRFLVSTSKRHIISISFLIFLYTHTVLRFFICSLSKIICTKLEWHHSHRFEKSNEEQRLNANSFNYLFFSLMNTWSIVFFLIKNHLHQFFFAGHTGTN